MSFSHAHAPQLTAEQRPARAARTYVESIRPRRAGSDAVGVGDADERSVTRKSAGIHHGSGASRRPSTLQPSCLHRSLTRGSMSAFCFAKASSSVTAPWRPAADEGGAALERDALVARRRRRRERHRQHRRHRPDRVGGVDLLAHHRQREPRDLLVAEVLVELVRARAQRERRAARDAHLGHRHLRVPPHLERTVPLLAVAAWGLKWAPRHRDVDLVGDEEEVKRRGAN